MGAMTGRRRNQLPVRLRRRNLFRAAGGLEIVAEEISQ
jgi:hypothetical protein